jgi:hypothetical protein
MPPLLTQKLLIIRFLVLVPLVLLTSCVTKRSVVSSSPYFHPMSSQEPLGGQYRFGLIVNPSTDAEVARFVAQQGGLTYDFEFRIGEDVHRTLPIYLNSFMDVVVIESFKEGMAFDFVLDPKATGSLFTYIGASAAPRYELSIGLDVSVIKGGAIQERLLVKKNSRVEISAFKNTDSTRTETMRSRYEEQITAMYNELETQLRKFLSSKKPE